MVVEDENTDVCRSKMNLFEAHRQEVTGGGIPNLRMVQDSG